MPLERTLSRQFYQSDALFELERERIFAHEWVCTVRADQIPQRGDYVVIELAGESLLLVRTAVDAVRGFYNVCRHRGCQLVLDDAELAARRWESGPAGTMGSGIRCPYHAWTYTLDGALRTAPFLEEDDTIRKSELGLHQFAVDEWGGWLFVNLAADAAARPLLAQLGGAPERVARYPLAELRAARRFVYDVDANWKVVLENYNECYHCAGVHPELCRIVPAFKVRGGAELDWERGIPHREGAWTFTASGTTTRAPFAMLSDEERVRHKGELLYPNFMLSLSADHAAAFTLWPQAPGHTTIVCEILFHPSEIEKADFDPSDAADFWDLVNRQDWRICEGVQRGMGSRTFEAGFYAPMESWSLDIRRYIGERLGLAPDGSPRA